MFLIRQIVAHTDCTITSIYRNFHCNSESSKQNGKYSNWQHFSTAVLECSIVTQRSLKICWFLLDWAICPFIALTGSVILLTAKTASLRSCNICACNGYSIGLSWVTWTNGSVASYVSETLPTVYRVAAAVM